MSYRKKALAHYPPICDRCGAEEEPLDVHHRNGNHQDDAIENLRLLCQPCHVAEHARMRRESMPAYQRLAAVDPHADLSHIPAPFAIMTNLPTRSRIINVLGNGDRELAEQVLSRLLAPVIEAVLAEREESA